MLAALYYLVFALFYAGFVLHRSTNRQLGPYSVRYAVLLAVLTLGFFVPLVLRFLSRRYLRSPSDRTFATISALALASTLYVVASIAYYHSVSHRFDPFLQVPPPALAWPSDPKPAGTVRVLALGGSTTACSLLPADQRYPAVLQDVLRRAAVGARTDIEVFNDGADWYTVKHSLIDYATRVREWNPDVVIVLHGVNDLFRSFTDPDVSVGPYNSLWSHVYGADAQAAMPVTFEDRLWRMTAGRWLPLQEQRDIALDRYVSLGDFRRYYRQLIRDLKRDHVQIVLASNPSLYKDQMTTEESATLWMGRGLGKTRIGRFRTEFPSPRSLLRALDTFNGAIRDLARDEGVLFVDLASQVPKDLVHFTDDVHLSTRGARLVAELVALALEREGTIEQRFQRRD